MFSMSRDSGLTSIEEAREEYSNWYKVETALSVKVKLKCWINHSESRHRNNNKPFTFDNYTMHMRTIDCVEQIKLDMIDVSDLGGKSQVITLLESGLSR